MSTLKRPGIEPFSVEALVKELQKRLDWQIGYQRKRGGISMLPRSWVFPLLLCLVVVAMCVPAAASMAGTQRPSPRQPTRAKVTLPLSFEENRGQWPAKIRFAARGVGGGLSLTRDGVLFRIPAPRRPGLSTAATTLQLELVNARASAPSGEARLPGAVSYLVGSDPSRWVRRAPLFDRIRYPRVFPGIDLVLHAAAQPDGAPRGLEYDFIVAPGADPGQVRYRFTGMKNRPQIDARGNLVLQTVTGTLRHRRPSCYQDRAGVREAVTCRYRVSPGGEITLALGRYNRTRPLIIDPVVLWDAYIQAPGSGNLSLAQDPQGNLYFAGAVVGDGSLPGLPVTQNAYEKFYVGGHTDCYVGSLTPDGATLRYLTYLGGSGPEGSGGDRTDGPAIAVGPLGYAYVAGSTLSEDFPTTKDAFQKEKPGYSADNKGVLIPNYDAFVAELSPDGSTLLYGTYLGGTGDAPAEINSHDYAVGISVHQVDSPIFPGEKIDEIYVVGTTQSTKFPTTPGVFQSTDPNVCRDGQGHPTSNTADVFVVRMLGGREMKSTYVGAPPGITRDPDTGQIKGCFAAVPSTATAMALEDTGAVYLTGYTTSDGKFYDPIVTFPVGGDAVQKVPQGGADGFVMVLGGDLRDSYFSTLLGGQGNDYPAAIAIDHTGRFAVGGSTASINFPVANAPYPQFGGGVTDGFITAFKGDFTLAFSTYLGGDQSDDVRGLAMTRNTGNISAVGTCPTAAIPRIDELPNTGTVGNGFLTMFDTTGTILRSTYLAGVGSNGRKLGTPIPYAVLANENGVTLVAGYASQVGVFKSLHRYTYGTNIGSPMFVARIEAPPMNTSPPTTSSNFTSSGTNNDPVNTFTGELFSSEPVDLNLRGPMPLFFSRYYASMIQRDGRLTGRLGENWLHNFEMKLTRTGNQVEVVTHRGRVIEFEKIGSVWSLIGKSDIPFKLAESGLDFILGDPLSNRLFTFNNAGKLTKIEDGKGNTHTLTYVGNDLTQVSDGVGRALTFTYDSSGHLSTVSDGTRTVSFGYTGNNLTSFTDALGKVTTYSYDLAHSVAGLMTARTLPAGNVPYTQAYNPDGQVATQTDANGNAYALTYGAGETTLTDPLGRTRRHTHTTQGELTSFTDESGQNFTMGYDSHNRRTSLIDRLGDMTSFPYDVPSGKPASVTQADGTTTAFRYTSRTLSGIEFFDLTGITHRDGTTESYSYDAGGNLTSRADQAGNVWSYTYNGRGQLLTATNPAGGVTTLTYNANGTPASARDHAGNTTTYSYDALSRLILLTHPDTTTRAYTYDNRDLILSVTDERGHTTTFTYDDNGNLATLTDPLNNTRSFAYDGLDRLIGVTDPLGHTSSRSYDELGRVKSLTDRNGNTLGFGYDDRGRLTSLTDPGGNIWSRGYDAEAVIASAADPLSNTSTFASDKMGRITNRTSPLAHAVNMTYDSMGRITAVQDPLGNTTTRSFDSRGLPSGITAPGAIAAAYARSALGEITHVTDPNGSGWPYAYDAQGRLTSSTDPLGHSRTYSYDSRNRISHIALPAGAVDFTYDGTGHVTRRLYSDTTDLSYTYDPLGRLTAATGISLGYDANGRMVNSNGLTIGRDSGGRITSITLASGKTVTYGYNSRSLLTQVVDWLGGTTSFSYDAAGRLTTITRPNGVTTTYTYDNDSRLIGMQEGSLSTITLIRDAQGQVTSSSRTLPLEPSVTSSGTTTQTFDAASQGTSSIYDSLGRLTSDGARTYTWDLASRLTSYTEGGNPVTFTYDAASHRLTRTAGGVTRSYVWNYAFGLPSISVERQGASDLRYYVHTPGGGLLYSVEANDNSRSFYHYDDVGSTLFLTDGSGAVTASYAYAPYGLLLASSGAGDNPFTFLGQWGVMREGPSGLYYMRARYYDSQSARFISRDPIRSVSPRSINPYQYALGNPTHYMDPRGTQSGTHGGNPSQAYVEKQRYYDLLFDEWVERSVYFRIQPPSPQPQYNLDFSSLNPYQALGEALVEAAREQLKAQIYLVFLLSQFPSAYEQFAYYISLDFLYKEKPHLFSQLTSPSPMPQYDNDISDEDDENDPMDYEGDDREDEERSPDQLPSPSPQPRSLCPGSKREAPRFKAAPCPYTPPPGSLPTPEEDRM